MKKILISTNKKFFNNALLKTLRLSRPYSKSKPTKPMSKSQIGNKIGVSGCQIGRYESDEASLASQFPKLNTLKNICIYFQTDPKDFLGLAWIDGNLVDDDGKVILEPTQNWKEEFKFCPTCGRAYLDVPESMREYEKRARIKKIKEDARKGCHCNG